MIEWQTMAYMAAGCTGVMLFLRLVANDLELASQELDLLEKEEKQQAQRRKAETTDVIETAHAA
jgi:hypothetical protein